MNSYEKKALESIDIESKRLERWLHMKSIPEMSPEEINQELRERMGIYWHEGVGNKQCTCGESFEDYVEQGNHIEELNPDFYADDGKVQLLREMEKLNHLADFVLFLSDGESHNRIHVHAILDTDGLLAITTLEFLRKEEG